MGRSLIGVTGALVDVDAPLGRVPWEGTSSAYVRSVAAAGGVPVVLPLLSSENALAMCARLDGVVLTGGGDVEPLRYGQVSHPDVYGVSQARDESEAALLTSACRLRLPVLAICRGMQLLNVVFGGTLHQHLPDDAHLDIPGAYAATHGVSVCEDSRLYEVLGKRELRVNSLHHQTIDHVSDELRPTAFSDDGLVEALEMNGNPNVIGIQWHPELLPGDPDQVRLFAWLVEAASEVGVEASPGGQELEEKLRRGCGHGRPAGAVVDGE